MRTLEAKPIGPGSRSTVNAQLLSDLTRSRASLAKIEGRLFRREFLPALRELRREILAALEAIGTGEPLDAVGASRINALLARVAEFTKRAEASLAAGGASMAADVAGREARIQMGTMVRTVPAAIRSIFQAVPGSDIETIANATTDQLFGPMARNWGSRTADQIQGELLQAVAMGEDMDQARRRLERAFGMAGNRAMTVARTGIQSAANMTSRRYADRNRQALNGVIRVETLDLRTCPVCRKVDGTKWSYEPNAEADGDYEDRPPDLLHPNCRGFFVPWTKSLRDMGFDVDDVPPADRASMDGKVPRTMDSQEWLEGRPENEVRAVLGPSLFPLWKSGKITQNDIVDGFRQRSVAEILSIFG